jgi:hypothetical protein
MYKKLPIIVLLLSFGLSAQTIKRTAPYSLRGSVGIPRTLASGMFRTAFNGVYEVSLSANARIFGNFFVGIGAQNTNFVNNKNVFKTKIFIDNTAGKAVAIAYDTHLNCIGGFMKIGYDKFFEKGYFTFALNTGFMDAKYQNVNPDMAKENQPFAAQKFQSAYLEPEVSVNFLTDGRLTFSMLFCYGSMVKKFDPKAPRFAGVSEVSSKSNKLPMMWVNIGFGFSVLLGDLKR